MIDWANGPGDLQLTAVRGGRAARIERHSASHTCWSESSWRYMGISYRSDPLHVPRLTTACQTDLAPRLTLQLPGRFSSRRLRVCMTHFGRPAARGQGTFGLDLVLPLEVDRMLKKTFLRSLIAASLLTLPLVAGCGSNRGSGERTGDMSVSPGRGGNAPGFGSSSPATRPATGESGGPASGGFSAGTGSAGNTNDRRASNPE